MKRRLHMATKKKTYHQLHRTISFSQWRPGFCGVFFRGYMDGQDFFSISFVFIGQIAGLRAGVGTEQTVALRCIRALLVLSSVLVVQSALVTGLSG